MRFVDEEILIKITDRDTNQTRFFKSYLEKNEITVQPGRLELPLSSYLQDNTSLLGKPIYKLDLIFNVFSENRNETIENFEKMHFLLDMVKPTITGYKVGKPELYDREASVQTFIDSKGGVDSAKPLFIAAGLDIEEELSNGKIKLQLKYLPRIKSSRKSDNYVLFPLTISCSPNVEMGYIQVPYWTNKKDALHVSNQMNMIPISYKVNFSSTIVLSYADAVFNRNSAEYSLPEIRAPEVKKPAPAAPAAAAAAAAPAPAAPAPAAPAPAAPAASELKAFEDYLKVLGLGFRGFSQILNDKGESDTARIASIVGIIKEFASKDKGVYFKTSGGVIEKVLEDSVKKNNNKEDYNKFRKSLQKLI